MDFRYAGNNGHFSMTASVLVAVFFFSSVVYADAYSDLLNAGLIDDASPHSGSVQGKTSPSASKSKKVSSHVECNPSNNYLDSEIASYVSDETKNHNLIWTRETGDISIERKCLLNGLSRRVPGAVFKHCAKGKEYAGADDVPKVPAPCLSETYVDFTQRSMNAAMNCMREVMVPESLGKIPGELRKKLEMQQFNLALAMMRKESGFHVNAISHTKAAGGGQLTDPTIKDINAETYDLELRKQLKKLRMPKSRPGLDKIRDQKWDRSTKSNTKVCEAIINLALSADQPIKPGGKGYCDRIAIANTNPFTNYVYALSYMRRSREIVETKLKNKRIDISSVLPKYPLERERLLTELGVWGYNAGPTTIVNALEKVLVNPSTDKNDFYAIRMNMKTEVAKEVERQRKEGFSKLKPEERNAKKEQDSILKSQAEHSEYLQSVLSEYEDMKGKTGECVTE